MKGFIPAAVQKLHFLTSRIQVAAVKKLSMGTMKATNMIKIFSLLSPNISQKNLNNGSKVMFLNKKAK
jgi:hypothetical protein